MANSDFITHEQLLSRLTYNPDTGIFQWNKHLYHPSKNGKEVGSWDMYGYKTIRLDGKSYKLHRLAIYYMNGVWPNNDVDHINGIRSDNRIKNLRVVTRLQNLQNRKSPNKNKKYALPLGVYKDKNGFSAKISVNNKSINIGYYHTINEAQFAYIEAKKRLHSGYIN